ncbi:MAG TPA: thiamine pyrophosphate-dependent enzyme [Anaeromyxobacteraceae bacterium]|nr:thiamine pyrophosphate-dependent enzyme [Anaeromyxobacteraceae bacterium]
MREEPKVEARPRNGAGGRPPEEERERAEPWPLLSRLGEDGTVSGEVALGEEALLKLYRLMVLNRLLDERMVMLQRQGRIGFYIGSTGEEAAVFGTAHAMAPNDWIFPSYREHGAALLRGLPLATFVCDLFGNAGDLMLGHQMPCHEAWREGHFASVSSPIGTQIPQAVGAAWAARIRGDVMVSLAYLGDGATSCADFHAGLNFAGVHRVPVVFACRNNGWAISLPRERQTASNTLAEKACAYGVHGERVDGNDLLAVYEATSRARARAASGEGPTLLELLTYRVEGHSTSDDPRSYRPAELVEPWRKKDPILRLRRLLERRGAWGEESEGRLRAEALATIQAAVKEAEALGAQPALDTLFEGVYKEPLWQQREQLEEARQAALDRGSAPAEGEARSAKGPCPP